MMEQPFRKGSVLDDFSCIVKDPSVVKLMSEWDRCTSELKEVEDGEVNSLERKKPKKARVKADQSMSLSCEAIWASAASAPFN